MNHPIDVLKQYWGFDQFRPLQQDIIESVLESQDTLALLPTGGGKSICFQIPGLIAEGLCIVISPLIALMKDQVNQLNKRGISAIALHAGQSKREIDHALDNAVNSDLQFLYCSPERLKTELFKARIKRVQEKRGIGLIAVDEAHCISQWGYDFRPAYLEISAIRELLPEVPVIALTATATPRVRKDIQEKLEFKQPKVFTKSFARENLSYSVRFEEHKERKLLEAINRVGGSSVVYVATRRHAKEVAAELMRNGVSADFYHAGLTHEERNQKQENWLHNRTRVIVSTNAFGMGIDKPDVRLVAHMDLPDNLESYYQEAGRAGRDEKKAFALAICNHKDIEDLRVKTEQSLPSIELLKNVYQMLGNYFQLANGSFPESSFNFDFQEFAKRFDRHPLEVFNAVKVLQEQGLVHLTEAFYSPARVAFLLDQRKMYEFQIANSAFEPIIKALLRLYGGEIYQESIQVQESNLAALLGTSTDAVRHTLNALQERSVIDYQAHKDQPQLTFLMPKQSADQLPLDQAALAAKRKLKLAKMEAVIDYVHQEDDCRTQMLLNYFGELDYKTCGICDNCLNRVKHKDDEKFKKLYRDQIINFLGLNQAIDEEKLVRSLVPSNKEVFFNLLSEMLDHGDLHYDDLNNIILSRTKH
ncbi:RecQ family ATP-dependent DNA helicase [Roseivirga sp.]|uniref:RecQ family ATP-dependent DNA helicase n=1 Tax=Roseivirga sp. TaxID=1964215 RepID=UPI003B8CDA73